jgi:hypothetical protein
LETLRDAQVDARNRGPITAETVRRWHRMLYRDCTVPSSSYLGNFRGDVKFPDLVDYEVGVGVIASDGYLERVGVWSSDVEFALSRFFRALSAGLAILDEALFPGVRPSTAPLVDEVVTLCAVAHGEWVRIHPFVNGNGRTARLIANAIALRYELPAFVTLKPRPTGVLYARAAKSSMGRPPDFVGDHTETRAVFARYLRLALEQP